MTYAAVPNNTTNSNDPQSKAITATAANTTLQFVIGKLETPPKPAPPGICEYEESEADLECAWACARRDRVDG